MIEELKKLAKQWYERGLGRSRTEDECCHYVEGLEDGIMTALSKYRPDKAVFEANTVGTALDDYLYEMRNPNE